MLGEAVDLLFQVLLDCRQVFVSSGVQLLANHSLEDSTKSLECHGRFEAVFVRWLSATHIEVVDGLLELEKNALRRLLVSANNTVSQSQDDGVADVAITDAVKVLAELPEGNFERIFHVLGDNATGGRHLALGLDGKRGA